MTIRPIKARTGHTWRRDGLFLVAVGVFAVISVALDLGGFFPGVFTHLFPSYTYNLAAPIVVASSLLYVVWRLLRPRLIGDQLLFGLAAFRSLPATEQSAILSDPRPARALVLGLFVPILLNTYGAWKSLIPYLNPFRFDQQFAAIDAALHLGRHPWQWLQPILGYRWVTVSLDVAYMAWLWLVPAVAVWQAWSTRDDVRPRFFLTYALSWILLGCTAAMLMSSAGPCYYQRVVGEPDPYLYLRGYLWGLQAETPLRALNVQEFLWWAHKAELPIPFARISAMPSMHVAVAMLYYLAGAATNRKLGYVFGAFLGATFLGSIHLSWHYAIDGYVAVVAVVGLWRLSGWLLRDASRDPAAVSVPSPLQ